MEEDIISSIQTDTQHDSHSDVGEEVVVNLTSQSAVLQALEVLNKGYRASATATAEDLQKFCNVEKFATHAMVKNLRQANIKSFFSKVP
jgi:hypothetical protein